MDLSEPPLTLREKFAADQARASLLKEERMLRNEQKPVFARYLPGFLSWAGTLSLIYMFGAEVIWPVHNLRAMMERAADSAPFPPAHGYHMANAYYLQGGIQEASDALVPFLEKHPDSYPGKILMAKIELARHQPAAALKHLEAARETSLDRSEIDRWIADVKSRLPGPQ
jgi:hypothetical protein